jgi:hypothetical protein
VVQAVLIDNPLFIHEMDNGIAAATSDVRIPGGGRSRAIYWGAAAQRFRQRRSCDTVLLPEGDLNG